MRRKADWRLIRPSPDQGRHRTQNCRENHPEPSGAGLRRPPGHPPHDPHQNDQPRLREIRPPDQTQQPAVIRSGMVLPRHEDRFRDEGLAAKIELVDRTVHQVQAGNGLKTGRSRMTAAGAVDLTVAGTGDAIINTANSPTMSCRGSTRTGPWPSWATLQRHGRAFWQKGILSCGPGNSGARHTRTDRDTGDHDLPTH